MSAASATSVIIAIDGPAGAGKSTVGRAIARELGIGYLDTGAMYRAVTFAALRRGVVTGDLEAMAEVANNVDLELIDVGDATRVVVDGVDATLEIRGRDVTEHVSQVAANPAVRRSLVDRQRRWVAERGGAVVEGRDIGSVVFPDAPLKLFITASPRVRAERRVAEIGGEVDDVERSIIERDRRDVGRTDSPLTETPDMIVVDTTDMSVSDVTNMIVHRLLPEALDA